MAQLYMRLPVYFAVLSLAACGGGGGGSTSGGSTNGGSTQTPTSSQIITNAKDYSSAQITTASTSVADSKYRGSTSSATMDMALAQHTYQFLFDDEMVTIPDLGTDDFTSAIDSNGNIDYLFSCYYGGSIHYDGKLSSSTQTGIIELSFNDCVMEREMGPIDGPAALTIDKATENEVDYTIHFSGLSWEQNGGVEMSGNIHFVEIYSSDGFQSYSEQYVSLSTNGKTYLIDMTFDQSSDSGTDTLTIGGNFFVSDAGKINVSLSGNNIYFPYFRDAEVTFNGGEAALVFEDYNVKYVADTNGDGTYDKGRYFKDTDTLLTETVADTTLVDLAILSIPPTVYRPYVYGGEEFDATTPIVMSYPDIYDPDSSYEELSYEYNWYINGELLDNHSDTLPALTANRHDLVEVSVVVSDSSNTVESERLTIELKDADAVILVTNVPENAIPGEIIQFNVDAYDPDESEDTVDVTIEGAPDGVTFDGETVTWSAPTDAPFNRMTYRFTFATKDIDGNETRQEKDIEIGFQGKLPLARSGVELPYRNRSMHVGNFDSNPGNELLSTDSDRRVMLFTFDGNQYQQVWVYPYILGGDERVVQVFGYDSDNDGIEEVLVATENSIWHIASQEATATKLASTEPNQGEGVLQDINNDGKPEFIYVYSSGVKVLDLFGTGDELFDFVLNDVSSIAVGNVDGDSAMELVVNTGQVYDLNSGMNEWFLGSGFSAGHVATADMNGDGVDEIAGADVWGNLYVYSATTKVQLDSLELFNTCDIIPANFDGGSSEMLIVGACQWGNVEGYTLSSDNTLQQLWSVDAQDHGTSSLTVGDVDNDGAQELLWGSGLTTSGSDILVTADIAGNAISVKSDTTPVQLDRFSVAGWGTLTGSDERAVFYVPSTESGYEGSVLSTVDSNGNVQVLDYSDDGWGSVANAVVTDFNNDGAADIFLPGGGSKYFSVLQLSNMSEHWSISGDYSNTVEAITSADVNGDSYDDAIVLNRQTLAVYDVENQLILGQHSFGSTYVTAISSAAAEEGAVVLASYGSDRTSVYTLRGGALSELGFVDQACQIMEAAELDGTTGDEVLCLSNGSGASPYELHKLDITAAGLTYISSVALDFRVLDFAVDPVTKSDIYLLVEEGGSYNNTRIIKTDADGTLIWQGPALIGNASGSSLYVRQTEDNSLQFLISTTKLMYVTQ